MKKRIVLASLALFLGAVIIYFSPFTWSTTEEVFHIGIWKATQEHTNSLAMPAAIGWAAFISGILMLAWEAIHFVRHRQRC
jgi:hypothetical protein